MSSTNPTGGGDQSMASGLASPSGTSLKNALVNPLANVGKGNQQQTQHVGPPDWAVPYLQGAMGSAQSAFSSGAGAIQPFTPTQLAGMQSLTDYANSGANGMIPNMQSTQQFLSNPNILDPNSNPYLAKSVSAAIAPITQNFQNTVLPGINSGAESAGVFGGSRQGVAQGLALNSYLQDIGNTSASMYSDAYKQGLQTMLSANAQAPADIAAGETPGRLLNQVGTEQQQQNQAVANQPYTQLGEYSNILDSLLGQAGSQTTVPGPSGLQNAASMASIIAAIAGMFG